MTSVRRSPILVSFVVVTDFILAAYCSAQGPRSVQANLERRGADAQTANSDHERFAGFPEINKYRPGKRSMKVITSDGVKGLRRPKWIRAISELGRNPKIFRFKDRIFIVFSHLDGHRNKRFEATGECRVLVSADRGKSWKFLPPQPANQQDFEFVVGGDRIYRYEFAGRKQTQVRTSTDGVKWSEPVNVYKPPFWLWGPMYDPNSKMFWCAPHAIPHVGTSKQRQIDLINSKDGIQWKFVSVVAPFNNASESTLRFEKDRTLVIVIRRKYGAQHSVAVARPPYKKWTITDHPKFIEGEHFFEIGGKTFLPSRAAYKGDNSAVLANRKLYGSRRPYSVIYHFTKDRRIEPWATMDSMGDCSYPHLLEMASEILCVYYSQHEDKVSKIFLCAYDKQKFLQDR